MHCMKQTVAIFGGWGLAISKSCNFHFFIQPVLGDSLLSEACWQSAILWKTLGKSFSARKADARFNKSLTISSRGSSLRVRPEWLPLDNNMCFAKRHVNTIGIILLLGTLRCGLVLIIFLEDSFILISLFRYLLAFYRCTLQMEKAAQENDVVIHYRVAGIDADAPPS